MEKTAKGTDRGPGKKPYRKPKIVLYGYIADLTRSSGGTRADGKGVGGGMP